jgi:hypothetical protein
VNAAVDRDLEVVVAAAQRIETPLLVRSAASWVRIAAGQARAGDVERHDALVRDAFDELQSDVDVVLLAQASMARVVDSIPESERRVPVLSSPRLGVERLAEAVKAA